MIIFLFDLQKKGILFNRQDKLNPSSCRSALVMLNKRIPSNWKAECEAPNNMAVEITLNQDSPDIQQEKALIYRELANSLIFIAKNALNESLERTYYIRLKIESQHIEVNALTEGKYLAKLATIQKLDFIKEHLKTTVQVKEIIK